MVSEITILVILDVGETKLRAANCEIVVRRGIRFLVLEYTTSFDRVGTSTDHEVEVLPSDRIFER